MKKENYPQLIFSLCLLFFSSAFSIQAQDTGSTAALTVWKQVLSSHVKYPLPDLRAGKTGFVAVDLELDEDGTIKAYEIKEFKTEGMKESVDTALEKAIPLWNTNMLSEAERKDKYQIYFSFEKVDPQNPDGEIEAVTRQIYKGKVEKALKMANRLVGKKPFEPKYLELRSQIHRQLGNESEATADLLAYQELQENTLAKIEIKTFSVVQTRSISGTVNR